MLTSHAGIFGFSSAPEFIFEMILEPLDFVTSNTVNVNQDFEVDWGGGSFTPYSAGNASSVASGTITVRSNNIVTQTYIGTDTFTSMDIIESSTLTTMLGMCEFKQNLTSFNAKDTSNVTNMFQAWNDCSFTTFPLIDTSSCLDMSSAWGQCDSLTSFPALNTSLVTTFGVAWQGCTNLASFPAMDFSLSEDCGGMLDGCSALTSFPDVNIPLVTNVVNMFRNCTSLETIGTLNTNSADRMERMFQNCTSLTCLTDVDTTHITLSFAADDMFTNTPLLTAPNASEQIQIVNVTGSPNGLDYVNAGACP